MTPRTAAHQASPSITNSQSLRKFMSIESVMPSDHLILCCPLLLSSILPSIRVFSNESVLRIRWPKYWRFSFRISPSKEYLGLLSFRIDWFAIMVLQKTFCSLVTMAQAVSQPAYTKNRLCATHWARPVRKPRRRQLCPWATAQGVARADGDTEEVKNQRYVGQESSGSR